MPTTTKVTVPAEIIERACRRDSRHCMIAEAIQAAKPKWSQITVDLATIRWTNPVTKKRYVALTPNGARNALVFFDQGEPVEPFDVTITPIQVLPLKRASGKNRAKPAAAVDSRGRVTITSDITLPRGHLGGSASGDRQRKAELTKTPEGNVQLSSGKWRQYGLQQLRA